MKYSAESKEMYREFLKMFCNMFEEKKKSIEEAFTKDDWENYTILVHSLKSTSYSIGGVKVSEMAEKLEKAGKQSDIEFIKEHHEEAMHLYDATVKTGKRYIAEND